MNDYLRSTSSTKWTLDEFATWIAANHSDDKKKIIDYMKKSLENYSSAVHVDVNIRQKAADLLNDLKVRI